jgi:hypothetical protein
LHFVEQQTWLAMLTTKFKAERVKCKDNPAVKAAQAKFASKRRLTVNDDEATTAKRCCRTEVSLLFTHIHYEFMQILYERICIMLSTDVCMSGCM